MVTSPIQCIHLILIKRWTKILDNTFNAIFWHTDPIFPHQKPLLQKRYLAWVVRLRDINDTTSVFWAGLSEVFYRGETWRGVLITKVTQHKCLFYYFSDSQLQFITTHLQLRLDFTSFFSHKSQNTCNKNSPH